MIVESALLHPGTCYLCLSAGTDGRKFVDFAMSKPRHGRIYFCSTCFEEVCSNLGWYSPANWEKAEFALIEKDIEIERLKEDNAKLSALVGSSIPSLMAHLSDVHEVVSKSTAGAKRSPGRPKKAESGTS